MAKTEAVSRGRGAQTQPECALAAAVIEQALRDLKEPSDPYGGGKNKSRLQSEAISFFTGGGEWARSRHLWFTAIGLDEVAVFEALKPWLQGHKLHPYRPPEPEPRPKKRARPRTSPYETLALIPRDGVFSLPDICTLQPDLKAVSLQQHLDHLVETGHILAMNNGYYTYLPKRIDPIPRPDRQRKFEPLRKQVVDTLAVLPEHDYFSVSDIYPKRPEVTEQTVRNHLTRLVETGHLRQLPRGHYLKLRLQQTAAE